MRSRVTDHGPVSEAFAVTIGVKQGCVLAPLLFSLMFSAMLMDAYRDEQPGIRIAYRTDGHLLKSRHTQATMRMSTAAVHGLLFVDDRALNTVIEEDLFTDTLKKSLKQLQINPVNWEDLAQDRPAWRRSVQTGAAIFETNRIAAAKAKRAAGKSQAQRMNNANAHALPTCPCIQRTFRARIGLVGNLKTRCKQNHITSTSATPTSVPMTTTIPTTDNNFIDSTPPTITDTILPPPLPAPITAINNTCPSPTTSLAASDYLSIAISNTIAATPISDGNSLANCPHCDCTFTSRIDLVGHLRIHRTETGEPVTAASTLSRDRRLQCPHCPREFTHRMGLFGHMRIHDSGIHRNAENTDAT
ncbi:unnamed protein product [Schistocephalus solidus]|uniref:C2H2-type domain-containing protein n=1 Tax=Schistocephalus solidus TaxID=70667 RepID=A0A183SWG8_SCHSO|nr:unnamed protein product [Schistocephalus solidus]